jgi:H/ACA ribonucleoprotein complex subunit 4
VVIKDAAVDAVCHGAMLAIPGIVSISPRIKKGETVVLLSGKGELVAIAEASMTADEITMSKKGIAFPVKRVIMDQGTYPKMWKKKAARAETEDEAD